MATGKVVYKGMTYLFGEDGAALLGWQTIDDDKYYFTANGAAARGICDMDDKTYNFGSSGAMQKGWTEIDGNKYYFSTEDGSMVYGWQTIDNTTRHFDEATGVLSTNCTIDDYRIDADGVAKKLSAVQLRARSILSTISATPDGIFNYIRNHNYYRMIESTRTLQQIEDLGWGYFANYAMDNRFVVCYYFAAIQDLLFHEAGYESRIVYGNGTHTSDHYWNQVKINGVWTNYDACNGCANVSDAYLTSLTYTWYQFVYPNYD